MLAIVEIFVLITENYKALNFLRNLPRNISSCILTGNSMPPYEPASKRWFIYIYFSFRDYMLNKRPQTIQWLTRRPACQLVDYLFCNKHPRWRDSHTCTSWKCERTVQNVIREYMNAIDLRLAGIVSLLILLLLSQFLIVDIDFSLINSIFLYFIDLLSCTF